MFSVRSIPCHAFSALTGGNPDRPAMHQQHHPYHRPCSGNVLSHMSDRPCLSPRGHVIKDMPPKVNGGHNASDSPIYPSPLAPLLANDYFRGPYAGGIICHGPDVRSGAATRCGAVSTALNGQPSRMLMGLHRQETVIPLHKKPAVNGQVPACPCAA